MRTLMNLFDLIVLDPTLLSDFPLDPRLDRNILIAWINAECGALATTYNNTVIFKFKLNTWFQVHQQNITKLVDTTLFEYNPIDNYDRHEEGTRQLKRQDSVSRSSNSSGNTNDTTEVKHSGTDSVKQVGSGTDAYSGNSGNTTTLTKAAYDSTAYSPLDQTTVQGNDTNTTTHSNENDSSTNYGSNIDTTHTVANTGKNDSTDNSNGQDDETYSNHMHGNIGVTTTQQMIEAERQVVLFNVYKWIVEQLQDYLFIGVWADW